MRKFSFNKNAIVVTLIVSFMLGLTGPSDAVAATAPSLGTADNFAVLAGSAITATTPSVISGDVGLSPAAGTNYTGLTPSMVTGTIYAVDATGPASGAGNNPVGLTTAKNDLTTAYTLAAAAVPATTVTASSTDSFGVGTINNGAALTPGVYNSGSSMGITGTLTLNGGGDPNAVFIFQAGSTLTTASASVISLINGVQPCNVFWQVGSSATLGTTTTFKGNILALSSITDNGGSNVEGRLLARNAAVTLNNTTVTKATCAGAPPAPVVAAPGTPGGCPGGEVAPLINVSTIPNPLNLPSGPGSVTYTYIATNIGLFPMTEVTVTDNQCVSPVFASGDSNSNAILDTGESWVYSCTKIVSQTTTNTATAHGLANCRDGYDTASSTVVVSVPLAPPVIPPLIHLLKIPNVFLLPAGGGPVTYGYAVTNPGTEPLNNVSVIDNKCTGLPGRVLGHPGDLNKNNLLESNEVWQFTCQTNLTQTTTNIGTAEGSANGLTAIDFALATVVVATPSLPNTGFMQTANASNKGITRVEAVAAFYRSLSIGVRGTDTVALQTALVQKGFLIMPPGATKGYFGVLTRAAVIKYQLSVGLPSVGIFGPMTRAKLISELEE